MKRKSPWIAVSLLCVTLIQPVLAEEKKTVVAEADLYIQKLEQDAHTIQFQKGSAKLGPTEEAQLMTMFSQLSSGKAAEKIIVTTWGDRTESKQTGETYAEEEVNLALKRAEAIKTFLKSKGITNVETHSMADQSRWIAKTFQVDEVQARSKNKTVWSSGLSEHRIQEIVEAKGGSSRAAIIVKRDINKRNF